MYQSSNNTLTPTVYVTLNLNFGLKRLYMLCTAAMDIKELKEKLNFVRQRFLGVHMESM